MEQPHDGDLSRPLSLPVTQSSRLPVIRLRDRLFPVLTMSVALIWAWSANQVADYVGSMNTARALGALMAAPMTTGAPMQSFSSTLFSMQPSRPTAEQAAQQQQLAKQIATVEVVIYVWRRAMLAVGGSLAVAALVSAITAKIRLWHLLAALIILASTTATLIGLWLLTRTDWGGMPPLPRISYIYTAAVQSAYAIVLLIAFARKHLFG